MKKSLSLLALGLIFVGLVALNIKSHSVEASSAGSTAKACANMTTSVVTISNSVSGTIVATSSARAWARIQVANAATTTAQLAFANGAAATSANTSILLNAANQGGASSTPFIEFGLNTDLPYVGTVTGLSTLGATTVLVTQCAY